MPQSIAPARRAAFNEIAGQRNPTVAVGGPG